MATKPMTAKLSGHVARRDQQAVFTNLVKLVELGLGNGELRAAPLADLIADARIIRYGSDDPELQDEGTTDLDTLEYVLGHTLLHLGDSERKSAQALFGLTAGTRGAGVKARREAAVEDAELDITAGTFRTHRERLLVADVTRHICRLADERLLSDWEARLTSWEASLGADDNRDGEHRPSLTDELESLMSSTELPNLVQAKPETKTIVREVDAEPETIGEALHVIGEMLANIFGLILAEFDPGRYRTYGARNPNRGGARRTDRPRPMRTPFEYAAAITLGVVFLFLVCSALVGIFVMLRLCARLFLSI